MRVHTGIFLTFLVLFAVPAFSEDTSSDGAPITIQGVWVRPSIGTSRPTAAYGVIRNIGKTGDTLIEVKASIARRAEIHKTTLQNGIMKMERVEGFNIKAGETLTLKPKSFHIMLMGLVAPANEGDEVDIVFTFEQAGDVKVRAPVRPQVHAHK